MQEQGPSPLNPDLAWLNEISDSELDRRVAYQRELFLGNLPFLKAVISQTVPQANEDIAMFFRSIGLPRPAPLAHVGVHFFDDRERFKVELQREDNVAAFVRNCNVFISLPDVQDELRFIDEAIREEKLFGLPSSYAFLFLANTYIQALLDHENLHRIHELSRNKVPQSTQEKIVMFAHVLFEQSQEKQGEGPVDRTAKEQLAGIYDRLFEADEKGDLQVFQEGAMLILASEEGIITAFGRDINEILIDHVAQQPVVHRLKARGGIFAAVAEKFFDVHNSLRFDEDHEEVPRERIEEFLASSGREETVKAFLTSHFFDTSFREVSEQEIMRLFYLTFGDAEFFSVPVSRQ